MIHQKWHKQEPCNRPAFLRQRSCMICGVIVVLSIAIFCITCSNDSPGAGLTTIPEQPSTVSKPILRSTLPASWDENWFASPAVFDLDNDGKKEIIAARHSVLYVWNRDGTLKWRAPVGENSSTSNNHGSSRMYCSPAIGDFNGDGYGEIVICYNNRVAVYDYQGFMLPGWPATFPGSSGELRSLAVADIDNDGIHEVLAVKTSQGPVTNVWNLAGVTRSGWPQVADKTVLNDYGGYNQNIGCADLDGDGYADIVSTYDICHIGVMDRNGKPWPANAMFKGTYACNVPMFHDLALARQGWGADGNDRDECTDSPPAFADFDGDGLPEIILFSDHEKAGEYKNRGNSLWVVNPDMTRVAGFSKPLTTGMPLYTGYENNIVQVAPSPSVTTLGRGEYAVVVPSYDGWLRCYSKDATILWQVQFNASGETFIGAGEAAIGDLDNDAKPEIVFTTYSLAKGLSYLFILNSSGALLHRIPLEGRGCMAAPTIDDIDGDGVLEIIVSLKDVVGGTLGGVQIWNVASARKNSLDWPTGRGSYRRTGEFVGR